MKRRTLLLGCFALLGASLLTGCYESANVKEVTHDNGNSIAKLVTVDGCSLYRTYDYSDRVYFTVCDKNRESSTKYKVQVDEDDTRTVTVPTGVSQ